MSAPETPHPSIERLERAVARIEAHLGLAAYEVVDPDTVPTGRGVRTGMAKPSDAIEGAPVEPILLEEWLAKLRLEELERCGIVAINAALAEILPDGARAGIIRCLNLVHHRVMRGRAEYRNAPRGSVKPPAIERELAAKAAPQRDRRGGKWATAARRRQTDREAIVRKCRDGDRLTTAVKAAMVIGASKPYTTKLYGDMQHEGLLENRGTRGVPDWRLTPAGLAWAESLD